MRYTEDNTGMAEIKGMNNADLFEKASNLKSLLSRIVRVTQKW